MGVGVLWCLKGLVEIIPAPCGSYVGLHRDGHKGFKVRLSGPGVLKRFCRDINGGMHDSCDVRGVYGKVYQKT